MSSETSQIFKNLEKHIEHIALVLLVTVMIIITFTTLKGGLMPFVKDDPNINRKGRGTGEGLVNPKSLTGTEYREKEFKQILRRLKPLNNKALKVFTDMLEDEKTTEATKVKVAVFIIKTYQDMMDDLYKPVNASGNSDGDDQEDKPLAPIISFKVAEG